MRSTGARGSAGVLAAAGAGLLGYATVVERRWYALRHATVPVLRTDGARPLRVLHLSDLHLLPGQDDRTAFVRRCLALDPDLVVGTGDFLGDPRSIDDVVALLAPAAGDRPCLAVLGSNDLYEPVPKNPLSYLLAPGRRKLGGRMDAERMVGGLEAGGWQVIDNRRIDLDTSVGRLDVAGLGDPHIDRDAPERVDWRPPGDGTALRLGVVHAPYLRALRVFERHGFDVVLAGHTHGGQLRVPFVGALTANCDLPLDRARGLSRDRSGMWLHVSAGLGHSRYAPVRFCCRPEATLLDLVPGPGRSAAPQGAD